MFYITLKLHKQLSILIVLGSAKFIRSICIYYLLFTYT